MTTSETAPPSPPLDGPAVYQCGTCWKVIARCPPDAVPESRFCSPKCERADKAKWTSRDKRAATVARAQRAKSRLAELQRGTRLDFRRCASVLARAHRLDRGAAARSAASHEIDRLSEQLLSATSTISAAIWRSGLYDPETAAKIADDSEARLDELYAALRSRRLSLSGPRNRNATKGRRSDWGPKVVFAANRLVNQAVREFERADKRGAHGRAEEFSALVCVYCGLMPGMKDLADALRKRLDRSAHRR